MCEGGCSQFNRGDRGSRCNSGKLHIEDDELRKDLYLLCKKGLYMKKIGFQKVNRLKALHIRIKFIK